MHDDDWNCRVLDQLHEESLVQRHRYDVAVRRKDPVAATQALQALGQITGKQSVERAKIEAAVREEQLNAELTRATARLLDGHGTEHVTRMLVPTSRECPLCKKR